MVSLDSLLNIIILLHGDTQMLLEGLRVSLGDHFHHPTSQSDLFFFFFKYLSNQQLKVSLYPQ